MKKITFTAVCCFCSLLIFGQPEWRALNSIPSNEGRFDDIFFLTNDLGWAANGPAGKVYKTTDGGESWSLQFNAGGSYFRNIEFIDENIGFLGTLDGVFYKSINGGDTWNPVTISPNPEAICGLDAVGVSTIYGCGAYFTPAWIIKSIDSGNTWQYIDMNAYAEGLVEILFIDELHGFTSGIGSSGGVVLETFDGGVTWTEIFNSGTPGDYVWKLQLMENNTIIYGSVESNSAGKLIKSFDAGTTWEIKNVPDPSVQGIGFINPNRGWMGGHGSGFLETNDGGDTWVDINLGWSLNRFIIINENLAYCSGQGIYKFDDTLSIGEFNAFDSQDLDIIIAPIPIKDRLIIEVDFKHIDNLVITLYDINGKLIERLTRDKINGAGKKKYNFDFNYPSGSYILDFHSNNGRRSRTVIKN